MAITPNKGSSPANAFVPSRPAGARGASERGRPAMGAAGDDGDGSDGGGGAGEDADGSEGGTEVFMPTVLMPLNTLESGEDLKHAGSLGLYGAHSGAQSGELSVRDHSGHDSSAARTGSTAHTGASGNSGLRGSAASHSSIEDSMPIGATIPVSSPGFAPLARVPSYEAGGSLGRGNSSFGGPGHDPIAPVAEVQVEESSRESAASSQAMSDGGAEPSPATAISVGGAAGGDRADDGADTPGGNDDSDDVALLSEDMLRGDV
uniref:Uncharacterized protein n=1 Tax=Bicosoecida sp. CB-2014 TaxID=1486930 RepID=A0A7S1G9X5_9STRA